MSLKYKVTTVAYKDIDEQTENTINQNSIKILRVLTDLNEDNSYCSGKGFNLNDRLSIYLDWFKDEIKTKIKEGYSVSILEMPINLSDDKLSLLKDLSLKYENNIIIMDSVCL